MVGINEQSELKVVRRRRPRHLEPMVLMERDRQAVRWIWEARVATREQLQQLFFSAGGRSRCQARLTKLFRNGYIDRLPDRPLNAPGVYFISRRCSPGLRLLRTLLPDQPIAPHHVHARTVAHTLAIASCRIAVRRACEASGYRLVSWLGEADLALLMADAGFLPDAFFLIDRPTPQGPKTSGFFLEVDRSGRSHRGLQDKYTRYGHFYYDGLYQARFGTRALRVLDLVASEYGIKPERQIAKLSAICSRLSTTMIRFAPLDQFLAQEPGGFWSQPIWQRPGSSEPCALF